MNNLKKKTCNPASVKSMRGMVIMISALVMSAMTANAKVVYDFEDCEIGQTITLWNLYGGVPDGSSAVVEADPANPSNKVLHVIIKGWNTFVELTLPDDLAGHKLTDNVKKRIRNSPSTAHLQMPTTISSFTYSSVRSDCT